MTRNQKIILLSLVTLGAFLIFFRLGRQDMLGDDAHYAFRALGYFDYMASNTQTTPIQWFGHRPAWSFLGFHDHPFLYFFVQHIFFKIFGASVIVSRLTSALSAVVSLFVIYLLGKKLDNIKTGLLAVGALALNSYFIWTGRIGLLEMLMAMFLMLGLLFLLKGLREDSKHFLLSGLFFGLGLLTKYTILYALPGILAYLIWKEWRVFLDKKFWAGILLFLIVASPIAIYNLSMYHARGHFDVQFGDLFQQYHNDWSNLTHRVSTIGLNPMNEINILITGFSWPYYLIFIASFFSSFYFAHKKKIYGAYLVLLTFLSLFMFFVLIGSASRWLGVMSPFAALIIAYALSNFYDSFLNRSRTRYGFYGLGILVALFCLFYTLNTNHLRRPLGGHELYASFRVENYGYNQLDKEINGLLDRAITTTQIQETARLWWYRDFDPKSIDFASMKEGTRDFRSLIVYDSNNLWFPTLWTFEKWKFYHRFTIMSSEEFLKILNSSNGADVLNILGYDSVYLIQSGDAVKRTADVSFPQTDILVDNFRQQGISPEKIIHDDSGREAFYIYRGSFK
ncbi:phospholipid carrier-dependent glycosyltransferase [bacterium]|nr:MAG: phospholipid carrier-dependent glycosyltransferase [bacterium]